MFLPYAVLEENRTSVIFVNNDVKLCLQKETVPSHRTKGIVVLLDHETLDFIPPALRQWPPNPIPHRTSVRLTTPCGA